MGGFLGVAEHRVVFTYRGAEHVLGALNERQVSALTYGRVLDETSEAFVDVTIPGGDVECCRLLGDLRTWGHEMHIYRDGVDVWCGPVQQITLRDETATIYARDVTAWLDVRKIHSLINLVGVDLTTIALAIINDALGVDDPNLLPYLTSSLSGITGSRRIEPNRSYAGDDLRELARTGIDFTAIGRRIVVDGEQIDTAPLATLLQESFLSELEVIERGDLAGTDWTMNGAGVTGTASIVDAFYGVIERIADEDTIRDQTSADAAAATRLAATYPAPLFLVIPDGAQLSPNAPVTFAELVPGALVQVALTDYCRAINQTMRLQSVQVTDSPDSPDVVGITLAPVGTLASTLVTGGEP